MTPKAKEAVWYVPCEIGHAMYLPVFHGPLDGESDWWVEPQAGDEGQYLLWFYTEDGRRETCANYQTAMRWTAKEGCMGPCLVWIAV